MGRPIVSRKLKRLLRARILVPLAVYSVVLLVLAVLFGLYGNPQKEDTVRGSLAGRFESSITMEYGSETLHYRENEITNYLLIGVDKDNIAWTAGHQNGGQADFLLVLAIDRIRRSITPVMLDRDTMTEMKTYGVFGHPAGTKVMQLCLAQAYSGANIPGSINTVEAVQGLLQGVVMDHYVTLDMAAVPLLNDVIGGVEVTLQDDFTIYDASMTQGATLRLTGEQAEFFVRGRMSVADGTNASRMTRQQQYFSGFLEQFRQTVKGNDSKLNEILEVLDGHMTSDASGDTLMHDVSAYDGYEWKPLQTFEGEHAIDEYGFAEFWVNEEALKDAVAQIWFD